MLSKNDIPDRFLWSTAWLNMLDFLSLPPFCPRDRCPNLLRHSLESLRLQQSTFGAQKVDELVVMVVRVVCSARMRRSAHGALVPSERRTQSESHGETNALPQRDKDSYSCATPSSLARAGDTVRSPLSSKSERQRWTRAVASDVLVTVTDPTGVTIDGTMHADALRLILMAREKLETTAKEKENQTDKRMTLEHLAQDDDMERGTVLLLRDATLLYFARSGPHLSIHPLNLAQIFPAEVSPSPKVRCYLHSARSRTPRQILDCYALCGNRSIQTSTNQTGGTSDAAHLADDQLLLEMIEQEANTYFRPKDHSVNTASNFEHVGCETGPKVPQENPDVGRSSQVPTHTKQGNSMRSKLKPLMRPLGEITNTASNFDHVSALMQGTSTEPSKLEGQINPRGSAFESLRPWANQDELLLQLVEQVDGNQIVSTRVMKDDASTQERDDSSAASNDVTLEGTVSVVQKNADDLDGLLWSLVPEGQFTRN
ncbi:hypothetical protein F1559_003830 [Cyanidiococcus yangmingshanensis]|uniref:Uncharacterized protein n=1 Tax=Cyanidiococcus yangmingshanensis TaxID=2690220 RepID=A0A7J7IQ79_9RHOD|nr:hypothetical protein F1559_003830 [Cyanidiococcus yangmingshanensis]